MTARILVSKVWLYPKDLAVLMSSQGTYINLPGYPNGYKGVASKASVSIRLMGSNPIPGVHQKAVCNCLFLL